MSGGGIFPHERGRNFPTWAGGGSAGGIFHVAWEKLSHVSDEDIFLRGTVGGCEGERFFDVGREKPFRVG